MSELFYEHVKEESFRLAKERIDQVTGEHSGLMEKLKWQTYCLAAVGEFVNPNTAIFIISTVHSQVIKECKLLLKPQKEITLIDK